MPWSRGRGGLERHDRARSQGRSDRPWSIRTKVALLATGLVLLASASSVGVLAYEVLETRERELGRRALSIGETVAQMEDVQANVGVAGGERVIQPIAERVRLANNVQYVVVLDMRKIRYSSPLESRVGTDFRGGDEGPAFTEQAYWSRAAGVLGPSVRAFNPIMARGGTDQVGVVVTGILAPTWTELLYDIRRVLAVALVGSVGVGLAGAWLIARNIKRQMLDLEPHEIAQLVQERAAIFDAIHEGLIAIDRDQRITLFNHEAQRITGIDSTAVGRPIHEIISNTRLHEVLAAGEAQFNQQMRLGDTILVVNRVPVRMGNKIIGAVATFRDKTEVNRLAEEVTGVQKLVDSLRAANHEHLNKLHTIAGLVLAKRYEQAVDYIFSTTEERQEITRFLARSFCDYRISGLLLGKHSRAKELGIELTIDRASRLRALPAHLDAGALVVVLGNLLENAMDALAGLEDPRSVYCLIRDEADGLRVVVRDNGPGIPPAHAERVFEFGFSTKGAHRGVGLSLVKQNVDAAGGRIELESGPGGTTFSVWVPN